MLVFPAPGVVSIWYLGPWDGNIPDGPTMAANCPFSIFSRQLSFPPENPAGKNSP